MDPWRRRWQRHRGYDFTWFERRLDVRGFTGKAMKLGDWNDAGLTSAIDRLHLGVERAHRHRHIRRVRGDALIARAEDSMNAIKAGERRATGAGIALVAGFCD